MKTANSKQKQPWDSFETPGMRIALFVAGIIIVALIIILIYMLVKPEAEVKPRIIIDNLGEMVPEMPGQTSTKIEEKLYEQVATTVKKDTSVPESGALIRNGTVDGSSVRKSFTMGSFIVDIDSVKQSYIVEYFYGKLEGVNEIEGDAAVELYCIEDPELVKYDFKCLAKRDYVKSDGITYLLPKMFDDYALSYTFSSESESGYAVVVEYDPSEAVYMAGKVGEFKAEKMEEIRDFIKEAGLNPDDYEYIEKFRIVR